MKASAPAKGGAAATAEAAKRAAVRAIRAVKVSFRTGALPGSRRDRSDATSPVFRRGIPRMLRGHTCEWEFASARWHVISIDELQKIGTAENAGAVVPCGERADRRNPEAPREVKCLPVHKQSFQVLLYAFQEDVTYETSGVICSDSHRNGWCNLPGPGSETVAASGRSHCPNRRR